MKVDASSAIDDDVVFVAAVSRDHFHLLLLLFVVIVHLPRIHDTNDKTLTRLIHFHKFLWNISHPFTIILTRRANSSGDLFRFPICQKEKMENI